MISAVIHTYNEEKNLERCLSSLSFVNEIVLIDMGSNDNTCKIAGQYNAKIFSHPYTGFVEPARNFGIDKACGDWVLIVDADEEIPNSLAKYLNIETKNPEADFYRIPRKNLIFGRWIKHAGWWPDYQIRFFKKGTVSWSDQIHGIPQTMGNGKELDATAELSIIHHNYQTLEQYINRLNRYTSISAKQQFLNNEHFALSRLFEDPTKEFVNRYFAREGYKDGIHGLGISLLQSFSELVTCLKLWELEGFKEGKVDLNHVDKLLSKEFSIKQFWLFNSLMRHPLNFLTKIILQLKRKFHFYG